MREFLIGIDVGGTNIKLMIMDTMLSVVAKTSIPTNVSEGYDRISNRLISTLDEMFQRKGIQNPKVLHLAMGLPGTVDRKAGKTVYLSVVRWDGFNPAEKIGNYFSAPVTIENDGNINALGEYVFGGHKKKSLALITLGTGVGGGVVIDGQIFGGSENMAAELGHMIVAAEGGDICLCGRRGHLEAYCSGSALKRDALEMASAIPNTLLHKYIHEADGKYDNRMITRGVLEKDPVCIRVFDRFIHYLSVGVTNVMTFYNPEIVVIGGGISNAGDLLLNPVNKNCREMVATERSYCPVIKAVLGSEAGMYGACALAAQMAGIKIS